jgi:DNA-binding CsgD family transcriptional regulator
MPKQKIFDDSEAEQILRRYERGETAAALAAELYVSRQTVFNTMRRARKNRGESEVIRRLREKLQMQSAAFAASATAVLDTLAEIERALRDGGAKL